jgi:hypothetical protein
MRTSRQGRNIGSSRELTFCHKTSFFRRHQSFDGAKCRQNIGINLLMLQKYRRFHALTELMSGFVDSLRLSMN